MTRQIKFRGKRVDNGKWVYGFIYQSRRNQLHGNPILEMVIRDSEYNNHKVIPETVGQFTGLQDKNGKEIYEGDVLKCLVGSKSRRNDLYTIIYRLGCPSMDNGTTETPVSFATIQDQLWTNLDYDTKISLCLEITGNIHDND